MSWHDALGYFTLVGLLSPEPHTLVRTVLLVQTLDAIMCRVFAVNNGHRKNLWTVLGFVFGIWAVAILILLPRRGGEVESDTPPRSSRI